MRDFVGMDDRVGVNALLDNYKAFGLGPGDEGKRQSAALAHEGT